MGSTTTTATGIMSGTTTVPTATAVPDGGAPDAPLVDAAPDVPPKIDPTRIVSIAAGAHSSCAVFDDGALRCWGSNIFGELGLDSEDPVVGTGMVPIKKSTLNDKALRASVGLQYTCVLATDRTNNAPLVKCFGFNDSGQLGTGNAKRYGKLADPLSTLPTVDLGPGQVREISAGGVHTCALVDNGGTRLVRCWGLNNFGQLGIDSYETRGTQASHLGAAFIDSKLKGEPTGLTTGLNHTCVLVGTPSTLRCWGVSDHGQAGPLGTLGWPGTFAGSMAVLPQLDVPGTPPTQLAAGFSTTCVLGNDKLVRCFGWSSSGGLGRGDNKDIGSQLKDFPAALKAVPLEGPAAQVCAGANYGCARLETGTVRCWGQNNLGQLGAGIGPHGNDYALLDQPNEMPSTVSLGTGETAAEIACGHTHVCALLASNKVKCWGSNEYGKLGRGDAVGIVGLLPADMGDNLKAVVFGDLP
jgi:alpha-tubulin suppressor-like RCC1 family protein